MGSAGGDDSGPLLNVLKLYLEWVRNGGEQAEGLSEKLPEINTIVEDAIP